MVNACSRATQTVENGFKGVVNATLETDLLERIKAIVVTSLVIFKANAPQLSRSIGFLGLGGNIQDLYELCTWLHSDSKGEASKTPLRETAMKGFFLAGRILRVTQFLDFIAISQGLKSVPVSSVNIPRVGGLPIGMAADLMGFVGCSFSLYNNYETFKNVSNKMKESKNTTGEPLASKNVKDNKNLNALGTSAQLGIVDDIISVSSIALAYTGIACGYKALGETALVMIRLRLLSGVTGVTKIAFDCYNKDAIDAGRAELAKV